VVRLYVIIQRVRVTRVNDRSLQRRQGHDNGRKAITEGMLGCLGGKDVGTEGHLQDFVFGQGMPTATVPDIDRDGVIVCVVDQDSRDAPESQSLSHVVTVVSVEDGARGAIDEEGRNVGAPPLRGLEQFFHRALAHDLFVGLEPREVDEVDILLRDGGVCASLVGVHKVVQVLGHGVPLGEASEIKRLVNEGLFPGGEKTATSRSADAVREGIVVPLEGNSQGRGDRQFGRSPLGAENDLGHLGTKVGGEGLRGSDNDTGECQQRPEHAPPLGEGASTVCASVRRASHGCPGWVVGVWEVVVVGNQWSASRYHSRAWQCVRDKRRTNKIMRAAYGAEILCASTTIGPGGSFPQSF
jgi:hypothetical protein